MKYKWLNKKNNDKLIVFFNGWGMNENVVKHLNPEDYDVLMFYDYTNLETDFRPERQYAETNVIAWSMGAMIASIVCNKPHTLTPSLKGRGKSVTINGTLKPIDDKFGIPLKIYDLTISNFNEESYEKFVKNMFDNSQPASTATDRSTEDLKSELIALRTYSAGLDFKPDKILISDNDKVIPTKNQCAFWETLPNLKGGHCPFFNFKKWSELL